MESVRAGDVRAADSFLAQALLFGLANQALEAKTDNSARRTVDKLISASIEFAEEFADLASVLEGTSDPYAIAENLLRFATVDDRSIEHQDPEDRYSKRLAIHRKNFDRALGMLYEHSEPESINN